MKKLGIFAVPALAALFLEAGHLAIRVFGLSTERAMMVGFFIGIVYMFLAPRVDQKFNPSKWKRLYSDQWH